MGVAEVGFFREKKGSLPLVFRPKMELFANGRTFPLLRNTVNSFGSAGIISLIKLRISYSCSDDIGVAGVAPKNIRKKYILKLK